MKKIILFSMAAMLLSLSLNAQYTCFVPASEVNGPNRAPARADLAEGQELMGPFTTDNLSGSTYIGQYPYYQVVGVALTAAEVAPYVGGKIVGFRVATGSNASVYSIRLWSYKKTGTTPTTANEVVWTFTSGNPLAGDGTWKTVNLTEPHTIELASGYTQLMLGLETQETSSNYPLEYSTQGGSHEHWYWCSSNVNGTPTSWTSLTNVSRWGTGKNLAIQAIVEMPRTAEAPVFSMDGTYTITATCGNAYKAYVNGVEVTLPYTVQQTDEDQTIVVTGYGYGDGLQNSQTVTYTFTVPALEGPAGYTLLGSFTEFETIDFTGIMFCDQPWGDTHANTHPAKYTYWLEEVVDANSSEDPHKTNTIDIPVYKTDSKVKGFYTAAEVAADTDHQLTVDVVNADVEMTLENESMIYFYSLDRDKTKVPETRIARIQNNANADGLYQEMSDELYYMGETYTATQSAPAQVHRWDGKTVMTGAFNEDYMSYIPVIWSWGDGTFNNKRNDWDNSHKHNSYGSPYYKTGVGDVTFNAGTQVIAQTAGSSTATWTDGTDECCLYNVVIDANGYLPTAVNSVEYEPYMFRVWVEGDGLRNYTTDENGKFYPASGTPSEVLLYEGDAPSCIEPNISRLSVGSTTGDYSSWIVFGAVQDCTPTLRVRFYYKVAGEAASSSLMLPSAGQALYYAVEEANFTPQIVTGVIETLTGAQPVSTTYVNMQGMQSSTPFDGVNIVVTRYSDGSTTTAKVVK